MPAANAAAPVKKNSNFQAIVKRLFQNRGAVIGLIIFIVLALAAAFTFGDRDMPKQKDTSEQPTVAAPVETPEQDTAAADVPDDVETGPVETAATR